MFARSGGNGFDKQVRDQPLPQLQFKTAGSVRGRLHQVQAREYDHMLDIVHLEMGALRPTKKAARRRSQSHRLWIPRRARLRFDRNGNGSSETRSAAFA